ncbi:hypothetical protein [Synechococcus sp. NOUM97013]|uniref:hypothetical protein n=1 Tax=Synechococcus sp. NOUM97013 TaxID=1442555 RepID=UPI00210490A2|nr:hypothetical protein [Synechococcus sp. NOUM97013]
MAHQQEGRCSQHKQCRKNDTPPATPDAVNGGADATEIFFSQRWKQLLRKIDQAREGHQHQAAHTEQKRQQQT